MQNPIMALMGGGSGNKLLSGLMQTAMTTLKGQSPHLSTVGTAAWYATMNMVYSDYYGVAREYGLDCPDFYAKLAQAFLMDKDAGGPQRKIAAYYRCVARKE